MPQFNNDRFEKVCQVAESFELAIIYSFGSHAKAIIEWLEYKRLDLKIPAFSDVDIGVKPRAGKVLSVKEKAKLSMVFENMFSVNRVDLVVIPEADPFLGANIIRGERIYCLDAYESDEYELYILRRAGDLAPLERERISLVMEQKR